MGGSHQTSFARWRTIAIVFLILNCALGVNFAAYGALVGAIQQEFATTRALASAGLSMLTLALGLLSPLVGGLMRRVPLRVLMAIGIVLNALGYAAISQVHGIGAMLACYAFLIGPGFCLFGVVPCTSIISNWFVDGRGKALGIVNMPVGSTVMPIAAAALLASAGLRTTFLAGTITLLALLPLLLILRDRPGMPPPPTIAAAGPEDAPTAEAGPAMTAGEILRFPPFLILTLGISILSAGGLVMVTHLVTLGTGRGLDLSSASLLLAAFGAAGIAGAPAFGWLADKVGGGRAFAILCFVLVPPWLCLIVAGGNLPVLLLLAVLIGAGSNAVLTLFGLTMGAWLGEANIGVAMGLCYMLQIPFLFGAGPLAGAMFDASGSYTPTILLHSASFVATGLVFLFYRPVSLRRPGMIGTLAI